MHAETHVSPFTAAEEVAHALTHGVGALLSVVGLLVMLSVAGVSGSFAHLASAIVYGASLVVLYSASALYHGVTERRYKRALRTFDLCAIYLLIAGTYTPFAVVSVRGAVGIALLAAIWLLAAAGIVMVLRARGRCVKASIALYVSMGWLGVVAFEPLVASLPRPGLALLILGGVTYTVGILFFAWRRLPYNHVIWHLFVMTGSALHFFAILLYVLPHSA